MNGGTKNLTSAFFASKRREKVENFHMKPPLIKNETGIEMFRLISECYPICRSITGDGVRETLKLVSDIISIEQFEVPSGTHVFDWEIPEEWNIKKAFIKDTSGKKIIDFKDCNLHVLNYSAPVHKTISLDELKNHTFTIPEQPDWVPYRT
jgi:aminopeptidase-like protein